MTISLAPLDALKLQRPEWVPWLAVVEQALDASAGDTWDRAVPGIAEVGPSTPLLDGASIGAPQRPLRQLFERLVTTAARAGTPEMATLARMLQSPVDLPSLLAASICRNRGVVEGLASQTGADAEALDAVAVLAAVPILHACRRRWASSVPDGWTEPYCPICGAWPAFAEVRGIERSRFSRCGRCGAEWHAQMLKCVYCAMGDHEQLVTLVPEQGSATAVVDACRSCLGYIKALTRLQGCPPEQVMVEDLATVDLDLAAVAEGFVRPQGIGHMLHVIVTGQSRGWGIFG